MILTQEQIIPILDELLQSAWTGHHNSLPLKCGEITASRLPLFITSCHDLATIAHDINALLSFPTDTRYYIKWQINIQEAELPEISLNIRPVTPTSHHLFKISPQLTDLFIDYFIKVGRIPNPWLIS